MILCRYSVSSSGLRKLQSTIIVTECLGASGDPPIFSYTCSALNDTNRGWRRKQIARRGEREWKQNSCTRTTLVTSKRCAPLIYMLRDSRVIFTRRPSSAKKCQMRTNSALILSQRKPGGIGLPCITRKSFNGKFLPRRRWHRMHVSGYKAKRKEKDR